MIVMNIPDNAKENMQKLLDNNFEAFIIGGFVRDSIMKRNPHDVDIFTNATGEDILKIFPNGKVLGGEERQAKILTVIVDGIEISQYRKSGDRLETGNTLKEHLATCDFKMNAICCNIDGEIYNHTSDIFHCEINCVGNTQDRMEEDPLRIIRAIRFSITHGFEMSDEIKKLIGISIDCGVLDTIAPERIQDEFLKMIGHPNCFRTLYKFGVLEWMIPKVKHCNLCEGGDYHKEYVLEHMNNAYNISVLLTDDYRIQIATFLHDIGKPIAKETDENDKVSFLKHEIDSMVIANEFLERFKFSKADIRYVAVMIGNHMMGDVRRLKDKTIVNYTNTLEDAGIDVEDMLIMTYCDNQGNMAKPRVKFNEFYKQNNWLRQVYKMKYQRMPFKLSDMAINGHDVIKLGITNGKEIGEILNTAFEFVQDGQRLNDKHELMYLLRALVIPYKGDHYAENV